MAMITQPQPRPASRKGYRQQLTALIRKNFMLTVTRKPLGFLLLCYGIPLAILALLLSIPAFLNPQQRFGVASPAPILPLADAIDGKLVIVKPDGLGADVDRAIANLTQPLQKSSVVFLKTELELLDTCLANSRGHSNCFASVAFIDSPETTTTSFKSVTGSNHTWQYTIRVDPAKQDTNFDIFGHGTDSEKTYLPLQLAVNNAITGRNDRPQVIGFTSLEKQRQEQADHLLSLTFMGHYYAFIISSCFYMIVYRYVTLITTERESGMSQLIDSMGGPWAPAMRVFSWLITINIATVPCYVVMGVLYWHIIFPSTTVGLLIGWQVLQGLSINSSVTFAAAFFTKARVSAIYVIGGLLLLSVAGQAFSFQWDPAPSPPGGHILSLLFPTANGLLFTQQMILWQVAGIGANPTEMPPKAIDINTSYNVTAVNLLGYLAVQIIAFPMLAIWVERLMHGISYKRRTFCAGMDETSSANLVVQTEGLKKTYKSGVFKKQHIVAADGVSIDGHRGQILCLAGPNGSGKTTTLHMIAGFIEPTGGTVNIGAQASQIGICPQRNTLWPELTVEEHVRIWSKVKGGLESEAELQGLIASCDLTKKAASKAKTLSGGQKRKLQLACMFVGDSTVCLIDECTSGLDPLSRRIIWEILLDQRAKRSIVFTTHFLDEVDVLADHIVILSKGQVKCQGPVAELKTRFGNGYSVLVPNTARLDTPYPCEIHQDRLVYMVPDSVAAAKLASQFAAAGTPDVSITGPQVEDVFLNVAEDVELDNVHDAPVAFDESFKMSQSRVTSFWEQTRTLYRKRWTILWRFWWPYFYVVALPLIIIPCMTSLLKIYTPDYCSYLQPRLTAPTLLQYPSITQCFSEAYCPRIYVGNTGAQQDLTRIYNSKFYQVRQVTESGFQGTISRTSTPEEWMYRLQTAGLLDRGGMFYTSNADSGYIAYKPNLRDFYKQFIDSFNPESVDQIDEPQTTDPAPISQNYADFAGSTSLEVMSLYNQMRGNQQIITSFGGFAKEAALRLNTGIFYIIFFCLVMAIYPAAFVLYPAIEKARMVRSVQYANGVRRLPMWFAYGAFDFMFVVLISVVLSIVMSFQITWVGTTWIMLPILILYGLAALLQMYIIAHFVTGPLKSFLTAFGINLVMLAIAAIIFGVGYSDDTFLASSSASLGIAFGLFLVIPVGNVFRAMVIGFNVAHSRCNKADLIPIASIYAYGGPILLLVIQVVALLGILVWIEGDLALFRKRSEVVVLDAEKSAGSAGPADVEAERRRVEGNSTDLLRMLHLSKSFESNKAVDDVTLGLPQSEVLALLGPNGAGKSTLVNLIQSDLTADHGQAFLCGDDSRTRLAQTHLGVCPQYDVMDMLTTRQQLLFYARIKGITNIDENVDYIMAKLGLTPHANTSATKLSGGNKRKLSLAVALIGTPPVLVLDEPTSAMDAVAKRNFWKVIQKISPNHSILLTTHSMEEADALATRAAILSKRLLAVGTSQALREQYSNHYHISLILRDAPYSSDEEMSRVRDFVQAHIAGAQMERRMLGGQIRFTIPGKSQTADAEDPHVVSIIELIEKHKEQLGVDCYSVAAATLENVFLNVVNANNVQEEENTTYKNRKWYKRIGGLF